jgi:hypothetical protein
MPLVPSTFTALQSQGLPTEALRHASRVTFPDPVVHSPRIVFMGVFWLEMISSRAAFRRKTGHEIEDVLAG